MAKMMSKDGTHLPMRRATNPLPIGAVHCVGIALVSGEQVGGCGAPLTGLRRNVCEECARAHTRKRHPTGCLSPGDGGVVVVPDVVPLSKGRLEKSGRKPAKYRSDEDLPRHSGSLMRITDTVYDDRHGNDAMVRVRCDRDCTYLIKRSRWASAKYRPSHCSHPDHRRKGFSP